MPSPRWARSACGHDWSVIVYRHVSLLFAGRRHGPTRQRAVWFRRASSDQSFTEMFIFRTSRSGSGRSRSIDEQPVLQLRRGHPHAVGEHEGALELPGGDAAVDDSRAPLSSRWRPRTTSWFSSIVTSRSFVAEAGHRQRDAQPFGRRRRRREAARCCRADSCRPILARRSSVFSIASKPSRSGLENGGMRLMLHCPLRAT